MTPPSSGDDEVLLARIREVAGEIWAVRDAMRRTARKAFALRVREAGRQLAELRYDSLVDGPAAVRGAAPAERRQVTFEAPNLTIEVEISGDQLLGQVAPPSAVEIEVLTPEGVVGHATADAMGCFTLPAPRPGPVRLGCRTGEALVHTDWVQL